MMMAILINGAKVDFNGYEFGLEVDGDVVKTGDYVTLTSDVDPEWPGRRVVFRAHYVTGWIEASGANTER
jgi:hypothetical protein